MREGSRHEHTTTGGRYEKLINIKDGDSIAAISAVNKSEEETSDQQAEPAQEQTNE